MKIVKCGFTTNGSRMIRQPTHPCGGVMEAAIIKLSKVPYTLLRIARTFLIKIV
jgi:hypothetical protein